MPTQRSPKHRQVFDLLQQEIAAGKYRDGRIPSEAQLVRRLGLSRPTVARAIIDLQKMGLLDRRVGSGTYLRSAPEPSNKLLGLLVPGLANTEVLDPICREITRCAEASGFASLWGGSPSDGESTDEAEALCRQYIQRKVAGVFFAPFEIPLNRDAVNRRLVVMLQDAGIPVVLLDRDLLPFPSRSEFDLIGVDDFAAGFTLTQHLLALRCRRFVFVTRPQYPSTTDQRLAGCHEALQRDTGENRPNIEAKVGDPGDADFIAQLRALRPDAAICSNDQTAALLIRALTAEGVRVPQDLRVVGFDDVNYATLLPAPLTTMRLPCRDIGRVAIQTMLQRIEQPDLPARKVLLSAELVVRESCGGKVATPAK